MPGAEPLQSSDLRLLSEMERHGRASVQELAEAVGMSTSTCWRRIREYEARGLIKGYRATLDAEALGLEFHALVQVYLARHDPGGLDSFVEAVLRQPEVLDCYATTGDADYHLRICCRNKRAYYRFLEDFLFRIPVVTKATTNLILREIKRDAPLPLGETQDPQTAAPHRLD